MVSNFNGEQIEFKEQLPLLPVRDIVVYPFMILPLFVGRESSIIAVEEAINNHDRLIVLSSQKDIQTERPDPSEIFDVATIAMIMRMRKLPDGRIKILVQGLNKVRILQYEELTPFYKVKVEKIESPESKSDPVQVEALTRNVKEKLEKLVSNSHTASPDILMVLEDIEDPGRLADLIASNLNLRVTEAQIILETFEPFERLKYVDDILTREIQILNIQDKLNNSNKHTPESFLKEQFKAISGSHEAQELDEFAEMRDKLTSKKLPEEVFTEASKQLNRLERMHPDSSESNILRNYLEWILDIPWTEASKEVVDLAYSQKVLDEDHFDLTKVKERILEHLAVRTLKGTTKTKGPILCFSGPPGVGKTSLGKSIARATGRKFVRISLGGVKDESEIRGHRRTYVGSLPGRFIQAMKQAGTINPVIMLDEIDKLGSDYKGDPSSALLEVLDPEQNNSFRDHYLNVPYDLSNVMFIATANVLDNIPEPLKDRMEIISLTGYSQEEKLQISKRYLVPKQMDENGVTKEHIEFSDEAIIEVIKSFTREAGLRNLERQIGSLCRKVAKKIAMGHELKTHLLGRSVEDFLGPALYTNEDSKEFDEIGVATGLAWTSAGGEILHVEATKMKGTGITLTGKLGEVMKESAQAAIGYIRSHADELGIDESVFDSNEIHIHLPQGAIPKDGPSAGITLATTIVSLLTDSYISKDIAMTGEITLTGKVLPVGGIKEKCLAAMRSGIETIIIPWKNQKDLSDIPDEFRKKLNFIPVKNVMEVLEVALNDWQPKAKKSAKKKGNKKTRTTPFREVA
ncbi:MAG: endopeptidase La [Halobacteriovoraceae bacterium]|nr:endopeptidase La [Halobacteriovoraceae bacterium]